MPAILSVQVLNGTSNKYLLGAIAYYTSHSDGEEKEQENRGELAGTWWGKGAAKLELSSSIERNDTRVGSLLKGRDPTTDQIYRYGAGTVREVLNPKTGELENRHSVSGFDLTFSLSKSASIMWAASDAEERKKIEEWHLSSVRVALNHFEDTYAYGRSNGKAEKLQIVASLFQHTSSRENQCNLHTHCLLYNFGFTESGKSRALDSKRILNGEVIHELGHIYRNEMQRGLAELGLKTKQVKLEKGYSYEIEGVPDEVIKHFSKRSEQIKEHSTPGMTSAQKQAVVLQTRQKKEELVDREKIFQETLDQCLERGFDPRSLWKERPKGKEQEVVIKKKEEQEQPPEKEEEKKATPPKEQLPLQPEGEAEAKKLTKKEIKNLSLSPAGYKLFIPSKEQSKDLEDLTHKVVSSLQTIESKGFRAIKERDLMNLSLKHSQGKFSLEQIQTFTKKFTEDHLHQIGQDKDRWTKNDTKRELPLHLRLGKSEGTYAKKIQHRVKMKFSKEYRERVTSIYMRRQELRIEREKTHQKEGRGASKLYTLKEKTQRDSLYSIVRDKLAKPLQQMIPEGKALSNQYKRRQFAKQQQRYEKRRHQFKRKIFFLYLRGKITRSTYQKLRDGKGTPKSTLQANLKYATHQISKKQRDYVVKILEKKEEVQARKQAEMKQEQKQQRIKRKQEQQQQEQPIEAKITIVRESDRDRPKITITRERERDRER